MERKLFLKANTCSVYIGKHEDTGKKSAVKIMNPSYMASDDKEQLIKEVEIHQKLNHSNIVKIEDSGEATLERKLMSNNILVKHHAPLDANYVVLELCTGNKENLSIY